MTGIIAYNVVSQNSGFANIEKLMTIIITFGIVFLGFWTIVKIFFVLDKFSNRWKQRKFK